MTSILSDPALHEELSKKGMEQAKKFSWENTARKTLELIEKIAKDNV
jgi:glycosyltransferase involved in cell wall biosynthesis